MSDGKLNSWKYRLERIPVLSLMVIWLNAQKSMLGPRDIPAAGPTETGNGDNPAYINSHLLPILLILAVLPIPNLCLFQPKRSFYVPSLAEVLSCMNFGLVFYHLLHICCIDPTSRLPASTRLRHCKSRSGEHTTSAIADSIQ